MKLPSVRLLAFACCIGLLSLAVSCGKKSSAASPLAPSPTPTVAPKLETPAPKTPVGGQLIDSLKPTLSVENATVTGTVGTVTYEFQVSERDDFPEGSRTSSATDIEQGGDGATAWTPPSNLIANFTYNWHARATNGTITSDWSPTETFKTPNPARCDKVTPDIYDPLNTGGTSCAAVVGGSFKSGANGGWESDSLTSGLDYDIATCNNCTVEFDVTNFGGGEGASISTDVKWFSMGDRGAFSGGFQSFRDHPWKMHLEQRSDGDGTGMQLIWRNGATDSDTDGDPEYGDHRGKYPDGGPNWGHSFDNKVWHFLISWTPTNYRVTIAENGGPAKQWFPGAGSSGLFGGNHPYAPGGHRIEIGCIPRGESMIGARYRNLRVYRN